MTRTEFLRAYCDAKREERQTANRHGSDWREAEEHAKDRAQASNVWRRQKNRLQNLTDDEWRKQETR